MPTQPIAEISDEILRLFAIQMRKVNSYYGVPVYLRYGSEMNGMLRDCFNDQDLGW